MPEKNIKFGPFNISRKDVDKQVTDWVKKKLKGKDRERTLSMLKAWKASGSKKKEEL